MIVEFGRIELVPLGASGEWELAEPWSVNISGQRGRYPFVFEHTVPKGFVHDRASIPDLALSILGGKDRLGSAGSLLHDHLYAVHTTTRAIADQYFRLVMAADGVARWRRNVAWLAVRLFGILAWHKPKNGAG